MTSRTAALSGALLFVVALAALTIDVMVRTGVDALVLIALAIAAMVGFGVVGALRNPPVE
jgi:hypothetical protein